MVARLSPGLQERLLRMLLAVSDNQADEAARALIAMGESREDADTAGFHRAVADLLAQHHEMSFEPPQVGRAVLMLLKNFVQHLPGRVNRILDRLADNEFEVRVDAIDETRLMEGLQKVANRIALGLVLAALIVGAALLMDVPTSFRLFGYPGLAIMLFLAAAGGGAALAITILANDIRAKRRAKT